MLLTYSVLQPKLLKMPKMAQVADNGETGLSLIHI